MASLTDQELAEIQDFVDLSKDRLKAMSLTLHVDCDLWNWVRLMASSKDPLGMSGTFDPRLNDLRPGNSFWINIRNDAGEIIACHAHKIFSTEDFIDDVRTHRLFGNGCPSLNWYPVDVCLDPDVPEISGRIGFGGGLWVHPDWRRKALSGIATRLTRNLSLRHFGIDWYVGLMADTPVNKKIGSKGFGLENRTPLLKGSYPGRNRPLNVQMFYMNWREMLRQIARGNVQQRSDSERLMSRTA